MASKFKPSARSKPAPVERTPASLVRTFSRTVVLCILLAAVTLLAYSRVSFNGFVDYDDADYVTANARVQAGLTWKGVCWAFTSGHASNWHPLTWISHMLDVQLFGLRPGGHHLVSVGLHAASAILLFIFLMVATGSTHRSAIVAALFALHPLHVESVAWVSERKDVLSGLFFMLVLWSYAAYSKPRSAADISGRPAPPWVFYLASLILFALGLMSKPMLVTTPFVLLLLDYWPLNRFAADGRVDWRLLTRLAVEKLPFFAIAAASSFVTFLVQREGGAVSVALSLNQRLANASVSYIRYVRKMFWPDDLSVLYPHPGNWPGWKVGFASILLAAITTAVLILVLPRRKRTTPPPRYLLTGWFWFVGMMVPVIGVVQVGIQSMADRYTYLPMIGLFIVLVWGVGDFFAQRASTRLLHDSRVAMAVISSLVVLTFLTIRQTVYWKNTETLFTRAVKVTRDNYLAYNNLGYYYSRQGKVADSMEFYEKALRIKPDYEDALNNMGYALAKLGRHAEAVPYYERALRVRPKHVEVHNNLGNALSELGNLDAAIDHYKIVLDQKPDHADAHNNLAIALAMKGNFEEAIRHFERTLELNPKNAGAHSNLGNAYAIQKKFDKAVEHYERALKLNPDDSQAHNNLGNVLFEQNRQAEAIEHYQTALRLNPDNPEGHYNLGMALLRSDRRAEALEHFREALRLRPSYAEAQKQVTLLSKP